MFRSIQSKWTSYFLHLLLAAANLIQLCSGQNAVPPLSQDVFRGVNVTMTCKLTDFGGSLAKWSVKDKYDSVFVIPDGGPASTGTAYDSSLHSDWNVYIDGSNYDLKIPNVDIADEGCYFCGPNLQSDISDCADLKVIVPADRIELYIEGEEDVFEKGNEYNITCKVFDGRPIASLTLKLDNVVRQVEPDSVDNGDGTFTSIISSEYTAVLEDDGKQFHCNAVQEGVDKPLTLELDVTIIDNEKGSFVCFSSWWCILVIILLILILIGGGIGVVVCCKGKCWPPKSKQGHQSDDNKHGKDEDNIGIRPLTKFKENV